MTTPEQPANPPLTRKKMREIRNTGSTPIIATTEGESDATPTPEVVTDTPTETRSNVESNDTSHVDTPRDDAAGSGTALDDTAHADDRDEGLIDAATDGDDTPAEPIKTAPSAVSEAPAAFAPLPRAATPVNVGPRPVSDASVDLGVTPLTRRQARQQERIRTASVPVISPDVATAARELEPVHAGAGSASGAEGLHGSFGTGATPASVSAIEATDVTPVAEEEAAQENEGWRDVVLEATPETAVLAAGLLRHDEVESTPDRGEELAEADGDSESDHDAASEEEPARAVVNPALGASLLTADAPETDLPSSFDQILARSTGAVSTSNTLIMADATPSNFGGAVASTGEVILTGTIQLPEGLGSTGHARGTTDGKEVDAVLVDGELPAHSSPTPIAASAAISTVKTAGEVIKPPVPEKGSRLMMSLAITAGVLALALVGVLIVAFATGVFS